MGFPKRLLGRDENVVMLLRPHVKRLFGPVLLLLVLAPAATVLGAKVPAGSLQPWLRWLIAVIAVLVLLRWTVAPFVVWWNTIYVITNRRLVMRHGVFTRSGHDMPLSRLNDVSFEHNLFERLLGCGTLTVESAGERGQVVLTEVPRVEQVQRVLYRLSDEARQSESAHVNVDLEDDVRIDGGPPAAGPRPGDGIPGRAGRDDGFRDDGADPGRDERDAGDGGPGDGDAGDGDGGPGDRRDRRWGRRRR